MIQQGKKHKKKVILNDIATPTEMSKQTLKDNNKQFYNR